jgi:hypothetical protein
VGGHTSSSIDDPDRCLAGANALPPGLMTADERLEEVARLLAAGLLRLRRREAAYQRGLERNGLDFSPERSVHASARRRREVRR